MRSRIFVRKLAADGVGEGVGDREAQAGAAVGHALEFETWRSLVRTQGLSNRAAADAMARLAEAL